MQHTETNFHTAFAPERQPYASPRMEVIELELEGAILGGSFGGEDGTLQDWQ